MQRRRALVLGVLLLAARVLPAQERLSLDGIWDLATEREAPKKQYAHRALVPGPLEAALGETFDGVVWYRRGLPLKSEHKNRTLRVEFRAAATEAWVFCNGTEVARHLGGWTPFFADITHAARCDGTDALEVRVDEKVGHNTQGFLPVIQPHFGGLWQSVWLHIDGGPILDPHRLFAFGDGNKRLEIRAPVLSGQTPIAECKVDVKVFDGERLVTEGVAQIDEKESEARMKLFATTFELWSPTTPKLYRVRIELRGQDGAISSALERKVGFRDFRAVGTQLRWNDAPLVYRGILHWGYSPPHLAPPLDPAFWRRQLEDFKRLGFNGLKCCLWVPPPCVYELCDELGLIVWQEYPTWHPKMDAEHRDELLTEYDEFFALDRNHPSVALRSLTCETGHGATLSVIRELYEACHASVPGTLVVDDSSWIGWQRISDFWDEHPYGNNRWWPKRLSEFESHIEKHGKKPLILGECMAADTWVDRREWIERHDEAKPWWLPLCFEDQARFELWFRGRFGDAALAELSPISRRFGMANRKFQIERLRATLPDASYVVSVARDFAKARMGLYDDFHRLKWSASDFVWHRDTTLSLMSANDARAFVGEEDLPVVVSHYGQGALKGTLRLTVEGLSAETPSLSASVLLQPGSCAPSVKLKVSIPNLQTPRRFRLLADLDGTHPTRNLWDLWALPKRPEEKPTPALSDPIATPRIVHRLDQETLAFLENGGRVLLHAAGEKPNLRRLGLWFLTGAPFVPPHPIHADVPPELLLDLAAFDLETGHLLNIPTLNDEIDPILGFWQTHDISEVRTYWFAFDTQVGKGRLLVSSFDHESAAGTYLSDVFLRHLAQGPAPKRALSEATLALLRDALTSSRIDLAEWKFQIDPSNQGLAANWMHPDFDVSAWRTMKAGSHWENQGVFGHDGVAWYRFDLQVPADFPTQTARLVFEGIDDSATVYLNGTEVARFGDPTTKTTVWLEQVSCLVHTHLRAGASNTLTLRIVDHAGAGGLWKPVYLTTSTSENSLEVIER